MRGSLNGKEICIKWSFVFLLFGTQLGIMSLTLLCHIFGYIEY